MTRQARKLSNTGIYHIILRGNERKNVFQNNNDKQRFLDGIAFKQLHSKFSVYAYCLMDNHVHLLLNTNYDDLGLIMKSIAVRYASYYNWKYNRVGHVFQDRFKSEPIEDERYLLAVVRYIYNNPIKAGIISRPADYEWSSFSQYIEPERLNWLDVSFVLSLFANEQKHAIIEFKNFSMESDSSTYLDIADEKSIRTFAEGRVYLEEYLRNHAIVMGINQIKDNKLLRKQVIQHLRVKTGLSQRTIATLLGINKSAVERNE